MSTTDTKTPLPSSLKNEHSGRPVKWLIGLTILVLFGIIALIGFIVYTESIAPQAFITSVRDQYQELVKVTTTELTIAQKQREHYRQYTSGERPPDKSLPEIRQLMARDYNITTANAQRLAALHDSLPTIPRGATTLAESFNLLLQSAASLHTRLAELLVTQQAIAHAYSEQLQSEGAGFGQRLSQIPTMTDEEKGQTATYLTSVSSLALATHEKMANLTITNETAYLVDFELGSLKLTAAGASEIAGLLQQNAPTNDVILAINRYGAALTHLLETRRDAHARYTDRYLIETSLWRDDETFRQTFTAYTSAFAPTAAPLAVALPPLHVAASTEQQPATTTAPPPIQTVTTKEEIFDLDPTVSDATFLALNTGVREATFTLEDPTGRLFTPQSVTPEYSTATSTVAYTGEEEYQFYKIFFPTPGRWKLTLRGTQLADSTFDVQVESTLSLSLDTGDAQSGRSSFAANEPIPVTAVLRDTPGLLKIQSVELTVAVGSAAFKNDRGFIPLFDDGQHGDQLADDGIYNNVFTDTTFPGIYCFDVAATGTLEDTSPFNRKSSAGCRLVES